MKKIILIALTYLLASSLYAETKSDKTETSENFKRFILAPADDSSKDREFSKFITKFRKAVKDRNLKFLKDNTSKKIVWSFGDEFEEINGFLKNYGLDTKAYKDSAFWNEMDKILSLGGVYYNEEKTSFAFPYMFVNFPADYDSYSFAAVTGKKVNVRKDADKKSPVIETLSYEVIKILNTPDYDAEDEIIDSKRGVWVNIQTASGKKGYIFSYYMHSPIGYRAIFERQNGKWMLTAFISGD
jgi:hypothetical protein